MPTSSHNATHPPHFETQIQTSIAAPARPQTDRLPNPKKCRPPPAPATGKIPSPPPPAKAAHASTYSRSVPPPAHALAPSLVRNPRAPHALAALSTESATPPASPSSPHSTLQIDPSAVAESPLPTTNDRPPAAAHRTPETTGIHCNAPRVPDKWHRLQPVLSQTQARAGS